jgi:cytochrome c biogenesis protein CcdA
MKLRLISLLLLISQAITVFVTLVYSAFYDGVVIYTNQYGEMWFEIVIAGTAVLLGAISFMDSLRGIDKSK